MAFPTRVDCRQPGARRARVPDREGAPGPRDEEAAPLGEPERAPAGGPAKNKDARRNVNELATRKKS